MIEANTAAMTPEAISTAALVIRELGKIRQQRAHLNANLQDLIATECRMAARDGWDDPEVQRIGATIDGYGAQLDDLTARIAKLHQALEETPTEPLPLVAPVQSSVQQSA